MSNINHPRSSSTGQQRPVRPTRPPVRQPVGDARRPPPIQPHGYVRQPYRLPSGVSPVMPPPYARAAPSSSQVIGVPVRPSPGTPRPTAVRPRVPGPSVEQATEQMGAVSLRGSSGDGSGSGGSGGIGRAAAVRRTPLTSRGPLVTRPANLQSKQGSGGREIDVVANFFRLERLPSFKIYQYNVVISPGTDNLKFRKALMHLASKEVGVYVFDGATLFAKSNLTPQNKPKVVTVQSRDGTLHKIEITLTNEVGNQHSQYNQLLNIIVRTALSRMKLDVIRRNYYDSKAKVTIKEHGMELWPGYVTSLRMHEQDPLLCCEISHKMLRIDTALSEMYAAGRGRQDQNGIKRALCGQIVMTMYNNKTYRVDDVDFSLNPRTQFDFKGGKITLEEYVKRRYSITLKDPNQPLLISRPSRREIQLGFNDDKWLLPELCKMTGLTDAQRGNFQLMKTLGEHTRLNPVKRVEALLKFRKRMETTAEVKQEFTNWDLFLSHDLVKLKGRVLNPEGIVTGNRNLGYQSSNADWSNALRNNFRLVVNISRWIIIYPDNEAELISKFLDSLRKVSLPMGIGLEMPKKLQLQGPRPRNDAYIGETEKAASMGPNIIVVISPDNKGDVYKAVKRLTFLRMPTPSQVVTLTVLRKFMKKSLDPLSSKVLAQMGCKVGGVPWEVSIPLTGLMIVGFDASPDTTKNMSAGAIICSTNKELTKFFSLATRFKEHDELCQDLVSNLKKGIDNWRRINGGELTKIIMYRDGVGEGQLDHVIKVELDQVKNMLKDHSPCTKLTYIIVTKRLNTKFFASSPRGMDNPMAGTVIDNVVTLPERYDFYLVSQSVREGTVNPTAYNVIWDESGLDASKMQWLTYKLTHLYFNWPGCVRVPSVCQYAHKLSKMVGDVLNDIPSSQRLQETLYYL